MSVSAELQEIGRDCHGIMYPAAHIMRCYDLILNDLVLRYKAIIELQAREAEGGGTACTGVQKWHTPAAVQGSTAHMNGAKTLPILTAETPCCVRAFQLSAQELEGRGAACREGGAGRALHPPQAGTGGRSPILISSLLSRMSLSHPSGEIPALQLILPEVCAVAGFALVVFKPLHYLFSSGA
jgi:hypothetical protein